MDSKEKTFGDRIRELRMQKGMTLRKFAEAAEIQPSLVSKYERNERKEPSGPHLRAIALALGTSVDFLLTGAERVVEYTDRYESRGALLRRAEATGRYLPSAIQAVRYMALDADSDPGGAYWLAELEEVDRFLRRREAGLTLVEGGDPLADLDKPKGRKQ